MHTPFEYVAPIVLTQILAGFIEFSKIRRGSLVENFPLITVAPKSARKQIISNLGKALKADGHFSIGLL